MKKFLRWFRKSKTDHITEIVYEYAQEINEAAMYAGIQPPIDTLNRLQDAVRDLKAFSMSIEQPIVIPRKTFEKYQELLQHVENYPFMATSDGRDMRIKNEIPNELRGGNKPLVRWLVRAEKLTEEV